MPRIPTSGRIPTVGRIPAVGKVAQTRRPIQLIPGKNPFLYIDPSVSVQQSSSNVVCGLPNLAEVGRGMTTPQGTTAAQYPTVASSGGFNHLDFNGAQIITMTGDAALSARLSAKTNQVFFAVARWDSVATPYANTIFNANVGIGGGANYTLFHAGASGSAVLFGVRDTATAKTGETAAGVITAGQRFLLTCWFDGSGTGNAGRMKIRVNGVERALTFTGTIPAQTLTMTAATGQVLLGNTPITVGRLLDGQISFLQGYDVAIDYATEVPLAEATLNRIYSIY